jgi:hypothetical protein
MLQRGTLTRLGRELKGLCHWPVVAIARATTGCGNNGIESGKRTLSCGPQDGLASPNWEVGAIVLGDSLAAWLAPKPGQDPYPEVLRRLRTHPALKGVSHPETVEGHAFLRALGSIGADGDFVTRLATTLREEVRARRLTLRDVTSAAGGPDREPLLVISALYGLPDSLLAFAGAGTVLCHEMHGLLPLFDRGYASYLGDLGGDAGPFVAAMETVYRSGPVGRGIVDSIIRAAKPFPGLSGFVHRVAEGLTDAARNAERPL